MIRVPTDLKVVERIYKDYCDRFPKFGENFPQQRNKYFVPINIQEVAKKLKVDPDIIMGRLFNLDSKYGYLYNGTTRVGLFNLLKNENLDGDSINFPLLATIYAELKDKNSKHVSAIVISWVSIAIALLALIINFMSEFRAP